LWLFFELTEEQTKESKPKVQSHNDKLDILIQKELNSKKPSKKKIKSLLKVKNITQEHLKNKKVV
jgi:hypothetical protein